MMDLIMRMAFSMPWWVGLILAAIFYAWALIDAAHTPSEPGPDQLISRLSNMLIKSVAFISLAAGAANGVRALIRHFVARAKNRNMGRGWNNSGTGVAVGSANVRTGSDRNAAPSCPSCGAKMALQTAQRGALAGSKFWGCPDYPACKGTRKVSSTDALLG